MLEILVVICAVFVWVTYHKIFNVIYFDLSRGCITEIIVSLVGGIIIGYLIMHYWFLAIPIILLLIYGIIKK